MFFKDCGTMREKKKGGKGGENHMPGDGVMILIIFGIIIFVPLIIVFTVLIVSKKKRQRKKETYMGKTYGKVIRIVDKGLDYPYVLYVQYQVNGMTYKIRETAKMKSSAIRVAGIPIGQRKTFVLGRVQEGDMLEIRYDERHPEKAIIYRNDGVVTG